jgi:hypothetical protein
MFPCERGKVRLKALSEDGERNGVINTAIGCHLTGRKTQLLLIELASTGEVLGRQRGARDVDLHDHPSWSSCPVAE